MARPAAVRYVLVIPWPVSFLPRTG